MNTMRLADPKFVTLDSIGKETLRVCCALGLIECTAQRITPTELGITSGIVQLAENGTITVRQLFIVE